MLGYHTSFTLTFRKFQPVLLTFVDLFQIIQIVRLIYNMSWAGAWENFPHRGSCEVGQFAAEAEDVRMSHHVLCWAGYRRAGEVEAAVELLQLEPLARIEVIHILGKARNVIIFFSNCWVYPRCSNYKIKRAVMLSELEQLQITVVTTSFLAIQSLSLEISYIGTLISGSSRCLHSSCLGSEHLRDKLEIGIRISYLAHNPRGFLDFIVEVCFQASGETLIVLNPSDFEGKSAKSVKQTLASHVGVSRFRQRLFLSDALCEIPDDEVFGSMSMKVQLVVLDFWQPDAKQDAPMMLACSNGDSVALERFLQRPRDPNVKDRCGLTPLHRAAWNGHVEPMRLLLEAGAENDARTTGNLAMSPMHLAVRSGCLDAVRFLLEAGADKAPIADSGATPLLLAACDGHLDIVRLLVEVGADKEQADISAATPLWLAAQEGHGDIVRFLIDVGANKNQTALFDGSTPLHVAAAKGHLNVVRMLIQSGANKEAPTLDFGSTPMHCAVLEAHVDIVGLLIDAKADKDQPTTDDGSTPLHIAIEEGNLDIVRLLVEAGANMDVPTSDTGSAPLHMAAQHGHLEIVRLLVESGADMSGATKNGATALELAFQHGHVNVGRFLAERGAKSRHWMDMILKHVQLGKIMP